MDISLVFIDYVRDIVLTGKSLYGLTIKIVLTTQLLLTLALVEEGSFTYINLRFAGEK